ncbi:MAG TPA: DUF3866 family protein [Acidimicrobiales bacterium]|nr:DUF3866 family protein [Acidimicrobiales bacterium]
MPSFSAGVVTAVLSERRGLQRVEVGGSPAYVLTDLVGPVAVGDEVVVNTTAVDLGLGTGGWHVVHWNLSRRGWSQPGPGMVLKLRYTSLQADVGAAEEAPGYEPPPGGLGGTPVVACALHSQIAPVAAILAEARPGWRIAYVMTDGASLPLALSDLVADLCGAGLLATTVSCGQAFGGDHEAVNLHSALEVAVRTGVDAVVVAAGPGGVGTRTRLGFSGLEVASVVDAAALLGGRPVVAVRYSGADRRERHRGVSDHTATSLWAAARPAIVAVPRGERPAMPALAAHHSVMEVDVPDVARLLAAHGLEVETMGRGTADDPDFFRWAAAAGVAAAQLTAGG